MSAQDLIDQDILAQQQGSRECRHSPVLIKGSASQHLHMTQGFKRAQVPRAHIRPSQKQGGYLTRHFLLQHAQEIEQIVVSPCPVPSANQGESHSHGQLAACAWVAPAHGAARRAAFDQIFAGMPRPPRANIEAYSLTTIRAILAESDLVTLLTRPDHRGRVMALFATSLGLSQVAGFLITGWLATTTSPAFAVVVMAVVGLVIATAAYLLWPAAQVRADVRALEHSGTS